MRGQTVGRPPWTGTVRTCPCTPAPAPETKQPRHHHSLICSRFASVAAAAVAVACQTFGAEHLRLNCVCNYAAAMIDCCVCVCLYRCVCVLVGGWARGMWRYMACRMCRFGGRLPATTNWRQPERGHVSGASACAAATWTHESARVVAGSELVSAGKLPGNMVGVGFVRGRSIVMTLLDICVGTPFSRSSFHYAPLKNISWPNNFKTL